MQIDTVEQALGFIKAAGSAENCPLNLYVTALAFSKLFNADYDVKEGLAHIESMTVCLHACYESRKSDMDVPASRQGCLAEVLYEEFGYKGDGTGISDPADADMAQVVKNRKGASFPLGVLYLHLAREMEWEAAALNFPGYFLVRLGRDGESLIVDPFNNGRALDAADLRMILKSVTGQDAELSHSYYEPLDDHAVIVKLQNSFKKMLIENERYEDAITLIEALRIFDPDEYRLLFDAAILKTKTGQVQAAKIDALAFLEHVPAGQDRVLGEQLLYEIERSLN